VFGRREQEAHNQAVAREHLFDNGVQVAALVLLNPFRRVAQLGDGVDAAARLGPQALGVGPRMCLDSLQPLEQ
jgi:hypothetical protein